MDKQAETQSAQSTEVVVEARNLSKTYRDFWGRSKKVALKPLDLEIWMLSFQISRFGTQASRSISWDASSRSKGLGAKPLDP